MKLPRRKLLRLSALGAFGVAGCMSDRDPPIQGNFDETPTDAPPPTSTASGTGGGPGDATDEPAPTEHSLPDPEDLCSADAAIESDDPLAVAFDARERLRCTGQPLDNFESIDDWRTVRGSLAADEEHAFVGSQSALLEAGPDDRRVRIARRFPGGIDLTGQDLSLAVRLETPTAQGLVVRLGAPDGKNELLLRQNLWQAGWVRLDLSPFQERGSPDLTSVTEISIQVYTGTGNEARLHVDSLRRQPRSGSGRAVLTFNNNFRSQYETAFPTMEEYGFEGVVGAVPESTEWDGKIPMSGLEEMQAAGWDVVSAPRIAGGLRGATSDQQAASIRESKQWLVDNGFERGADVLVWPQGQYDRSSLDAASRYHHLGFAGGNTPVGMLSQPLTIGRVAGSDVEAARQAIDFAAAYDQLVVVSYNSIGNMIDGISSARFERVLSYIDEQGLDVVTASELWGSLQ